MAELRAALEAALAGSGRVVLLAGEPGINQNFPEVAVDADGDSVVVWHSDGSAGTDTDSVSIQGQRYASNGTPLGTEFQVNTYTLRIQSFPHVAMDPGGGFVVVWENVDAGYIGVQGRRYDSNGIPFGDQFPASTSMNTVCPVVAMDAASRFVSVFDNFPSSSPDGSSDIFALRFAAPPGPIPVKVAIIKPDKLFKFVAKGTFTRPNPMVDNPTAEGGSLSFAGMLGGGQTYPLPPDCWKGLGPGGDGSKGFKCKGTTCKVTVKEKIIKGVCRLDTGTAVLPELGPVSIVLTVGTGTTRYCGLCGGTPKGDPNKVFKQTTCPAPLACP